MSARCCSASCARAFSSRTRCLPSRWTDLSNESSRSVTEEEEEEEGEENDDDDDEKVEDEEEDEEEAG